MRKKLIVIGGPTASGKTALAVALAKKYNTVVLSGDSRQFYKEMNIGTAKPTLEEREGIPHYFIDSHSITDELNASGYAKEAEEVLHNLFQDKDCIILVGGSGMFMDALCYGLDEIPHDITIQEAFNQRFKTEGLLPLVEELKQQDPEFCQQADLSNPVRVIRALEVIALTGEKFSVLRKNQRKQQDFDIHYFAIEVEREVLYARINERVDNMLENGLEQEVTSLKAHKDLKSMQTVGYSEWFDFWDGKTERDTCIEMIKQNSRRYAKRQMTWFRKNKDIKWIPYTNLEEMTAFVDGKIEIA